MAVVLVEDYDSPVNGFADVVARDEEFVRGERRKSGGDKRHVRSVVGEDTVGGEYMGVPHGYVVRNLLAVVVENFKYFVLE
jgi:hypothetical protein